MNIEILKYIDVMAKILCIFSIISYNTYALELPEELPLPEVTIVNSPSQGGIFMAPFGENVTPNGPFKHYLMVLDST